MSFEFFNPWVLVGVVAVAAAAVAARRSFAPVGRAQGTLHLALRILAILALLAAVSGIAWERSRTGAGRFVVFLSQRPDDSRALAASAAAGTAARPEDRVITRAWGESLDETLGLVPAWIPEDTSGRVVLIGPETSIDEAVIASARRLRDQDIPVHVIGGSASEPPGVAIVSAGPASEVRAGTPFDIVATVQKSADAARPRPLAVQVRLSHSLAPTAQSESRPVGPRPGRENLILPGRVAQMGTHLYRLDLVRSDPSNPVGPAALVPVWAGPPLRVLLLRGAETPVEHLSNALATAGMQIETISADEVSSKVPQWEIYDLVMLVNVPSMGIKAKEQDALRRYVFSGGGLVMVGGEASFGCGGYYRTALERALPVYMDPLREPPKYALMIVFDKSWSMGDAVAKTIHKVDLMREVSIAASTPMTPHDLFGLVSFDSQPHSIIELRKIADRKLVTDTISTLGAFGTTNFYRAMSKAHEVLKPAKATYKHIVLLSDGRSSVPNLNYETLVEAMRKDRITVSTVGVGDDCHRQLLASIAGWGKGRTYHVGTVDRIPQILLEEAKRMKEILTVEVPSAVKVKTDDEVLSAVDMRTCPKLLGFNRVRAKESALALLTVSPKEEPLLSVWHYGTGRAAAFASDAWPRWSADWLEKWPEGYARLWAQIVQWVARVAPGSGSGVKLVRAEFGGELAFEAVDAWGSPVTGLSLTAEVHQWQNGKRQSKAVTLAERGAGLYVATLSAVPRPPYLVRLVDEERRTHAVLGVPRTTRMPIDAAERLKRATELAKAGGGRVNPKPEQIFETRRKVVSRHVSIQPVMLLAALVFFLLDVIVRRYTALVRLIRNV
ncbi:MAG: hypothetical protein AMK75_03950 [Planctomycetes bacterium SM23_65]|nr:MAG: hypothetical protein AMK75_03950 [Planctomycetes bacterium SM23_65]